MAGRRTPAWCGTGERGEVSRLQHGQVFGEAALRRPPGRADVNSRDRAGRHPRARERARSAGGQPRGLVRPEQGRRGRFLTGEPKSPGSSRHLSSFSSCHIRPWPRRDKQWDSTRWEGKPHWRAVERYSLQCLRGTARAEAELESKRGNRWVAAASRVQGSEGKDFPRAEEGVGLEASSLKQ